MTKRFTRSRAKKGQIKLITSEKIFHFLVGNPPELI